MKLLLLISLATARCLCESVLRPSAPQAREAVLVNGGCSLVGESTIGEQGQDVRIFSGTSMSVFCNGSKLEADSDTATNNTAYFSARTAEQLEWLCISRCEITTDFVRSTFSRFKRLRSLAIKNSSVGLLFTSAFDKLAAIKVLRITSTGLKSIPRELFCKFPSLQRLNVSGNDLVEAGGHFLSVQTWNRCKSVAQDMDLSDNRISVIHRVAFRMHASLRRLNLRSNDISLIESSSFDHLKRLWLLDISNNVLKELPKRVFEENLNLRILLLQNNRLMHIPADIFSPSSYIFQINLSNNRLHSIRPFVKLTNLRQLFLNSNRFETMPHQVSKMARLQNLDLSDNKIRQITMENMTENSEISIINLSRNRITVLNMAALTHFRKLKSLNLGHNLLRTVSKGLPSQMQHLQDLSFKHNKWQHIPGEIATMQNLRRLDISDNIVRELSFENFRGLYNLESLDVSNNQLERIHRFAFSSPARLSRIVLSSNSLRSLHDKLFGNNLRLRHIDISLNRLDSLRHVFSKLDSLLHLNLSSNIISSLDYISLPKNLQQLDISHNIVTNLTDFYSVLSQCGLRQLDASQNQISRISMQMLPVSLEVLNLKHNRIDTIEERVFSAMNKLQFVDLSYNRIGFLNENLLHFSESKVHLSLSQNPLRCDCQLQWLLSSKQFVLLHRENTECRTTQGSKVNLFRSPLEHFFLCQYTRHCFTLCQCCDFDACDCEQICPGSCTCWHDNLWNTNLVMCSYAGYSSPPESIPMDATEIRLDGNRLGQLDHLVFLGRKNLHRLFLNGSSIHFVANNTFNALISLRQLHLEDNELADVHGRFDSLIQLESLYLDNNRLSHVEFGELTRLESLRHLGLSGNRLVFLELWKIGTSKITSLNIADNPWKCPCDERFQFISWLSRHKDRGLLLDQAHCDTGESISALQACQKVSLTNALPDSALLLLVTLSFMLTITTIVVAAVCRYRRRRSHQPGGLICKTPPFGTQLPPVVSVDGRYTGPPVAAAVFISCDVADHSTAWRIRQLLEQTCPTLVLHCDVPATVACVSRAVGSSRLLLLLNSAEFRANLWSCADLRHAHDTTARSLAVPVVVIDIQADCHVTVAKKSTCTKTYSALSPVPSAPRLSLYGMDFEWRLIQHVERAFANCAEEFASPTVESSAPIYCEIDNEGLWVPRDDEVYRTRHLYGYNGRCVKSFSQGNVQNAMPL